MLKFKTVNTLLTIWRWANGIPDPYALDVSGAGPMEFQTPMLWTYLALIHISEISLN